MTTRVAVSPVASETTWISTGPSLLIAGTLPAQALGS